MYLLSMVIYACTYMQNYFFVGSRRGVATIPRVTVARTPCFQVREYTCVSKWHVCDRDAANRCAATGQRCDARIPTYTADNACYARLNVRLRLRYIFKKEISVCHRLSDGKQYEIADVFSSMKTRKRHVPNRRDANNSVCVECLVKFSCFQVYILFCNFKSRTQAKYILPHSRRGFPKLSACELYFTDCKFMQCAASHYNNRLRWLYINI